MPEAPRILAFYRVNPWARMRRVLLVGPGVLSTGCLVIAVSFLARQPMSTRVDAAAAGFVLIAGGAIYTLASMHRILRDDVVLSVRTDGVMIESDRQETLVAWDQLNGARWDPARAELVLERANGAPIRFARPFARITGRELADRIATAKRRIAMNLPP